MFGFVGKLVGSVLNKVGLDFLSPIVSLGINFLTGNYAGMIGDVQNLVSKFSNFSFLDKLSKNPPLPDCYSYRNNDSIIDRFANGDLPSWRSQSRENNLNRANAAFDILEDILNSSSRIESARVNIRFNYIAA